MHEQKQQPSDSDEDLPVLEDFEADMQFDPSKITFIPVDRNWQKSRAKALNIPVLQKTREIGLRKIVDRHAKPKDAKEVAGW